MNASTVTHNQDNGVNITYGGGWRIVNMTSLLHNHGNGLNITINETRVDNKTRYARHQRTEVSESHFNYNDGIGVRVGNFCESSQIAINDSHFIHNSKAGVELESCFKVIPQANITNFTVSYNYFEGNYGHAIRIVPLVNAKGIISNNTFTHHPRHVLLLDNGDDFLMSRHFTLLPVDYKVWGNRFLNNMGFYVVNLRLTEKSSVQKLLFQFNVLIDNEIEGGFPTLNARTKANAVVVISSTNINCSRNHLVNPLSKFELASQLLDPGAYIKGGQQYWGTTEYKEIITRIFDHYSRFSLATIEYHPVLTQDWLYAPSDSLTWTQLPVEIEFEREGGTYLGGQLRSGESKTLRSNHKYIVDRDINVLRGAQLFLDEGTELHFMNAVGMFVQGRLDTRQRSHNNAPALLGLYNDTTYVNSSSVRLVGGATELEGRLEVRPDENLAWGTVCDVVSVETCVTENLAWGTVCDVVSIETCVTENLAWGTVCDVVSVETCVTENLAWGTVCDVVSIETCVM